MSNQQFTFSEVYRGTIPRKQTDCTHRDGVAGMPFYYSSREDKLKTTFCLWTRNALGKLREKQRSDNLNLKCPLQVHVFEYLVPSWWLGKLWNLWDCGLASRRWSLGVRFQGDACSGFLICLFVRSCLCTSCCSGGLTTSSGTANINLSSH